jgi:trans-aconitate 2-methyltransferase
VSAGAATPGDHWDPAQYHRFGAERALPFFDLLALVEPVTAPRVADLGCGTGELTAEAHRTLSARETLGVDSSPAMLDAARVLDMDGLRFERGDIARFAPREPFDVILSNAALHWVPDHPAVLVRWTRSLAADGQLAVQMPLNADHPSHLVAAEVAAEPEFAAAFGGAPPPDPSAGLLAPDEYAVLLAELGYERQHVRVQVYLHRLASIADVVEWVRGTTLTRFSNVLGPERFAGFVERYRERLLDVLGEQSPYLYPFKRLLFWGRRS